MEVEYNDYLCNKFRTTRIRTHEKLNLSKYVLGNSNIDPSYYSFIVSTYMHITLYNYFILFFPN